MAVTASASSTANDGSASRARTTNSSTAAPSTGNDGTGIAPWWILIVTLVLALAVFCVPAALATWFWQRGVARGDDRGKVPAVILIALSAGFLAMNLLALLVGMLMQRV